MEIRSSACKHGVTAEQIRQAMQVPMRRVSQESASDDKKMLIIGADSAGRLLEIVVVAPDDDGARVIHAMPLRASFYRYL